MPHLLAFACVIPVLLLRAMLGVADQHPCFSGKRDCLRLVVGKKEMIVFFVYFLPIDHTSLSVGLPNIFFVFSRVHASTR